MPSLFVSKTRNRLKNFILKPFENLNFSKRVFINKVASMQAYLYKAYHTGKGDDFESIAVVITNPSLPMDCSKMGVFGQDRDANLTIPAEKRDPARGEPRKPVQKIDAKTHAALWKYGGHFYTFQIDARPDTTAQDEQYGKGVFPVQLDYVIIKPPEWEWKEGKTERIIKKGSYAEVIIGEYKGGPDQRIMAVQEGIQLNKGAKFFKRMYGGKVHVKLFYIPYMANDPNIWGPRMPAGYENVNLLSITGLSKLLSIPVNTITNWGSARANWLADFGNALYKLTEAVKVEINSTNNKNSYLAELRTKRGPIFKIGSETINLSGFLEPALAGGVSNLNWKNRQQKITRALATRELLKEFMADPKQTPEKRASYATSFKRYTWAIKKLNKLSNTNNGILTKSMREKINASIRNLGELNERSMQIAQLLPSMNKGASVNSERFRDGQFNLWLHARQKLLRGKNNIQWPFRKEMKAGKDYYSPLTTGNANTTKISNILSQANFKVSKSKLNEWLEYLRELYGRAPPNSALQQACGQLIVKLETKNNVGNNSGRQRPGAAARALLTEMRSATGNYSSNENYPPPEPATRAGGKRKSAGAPAKSAKSAKSAKVAHGVPAMNNVMAARLQTQAAALPARTARLRNLEAQLTARLAYNRSMTGAANELGLTAPKARTAKG